MTGSRFILGVNSPAPRSPSLPAIGNCSIITSPAEHDELELVEMEGQSPLFIHVGAKKKHSSAPIVVLQTCIVHLNRRDVACTSLCIYVSTLCVARMLSKTTSCAAIGLRKEDYEKKSKKGDDAEDALGGNPSYFFPPDFFHPALLLLRPLGPFFLPPPLPLNLRPLLPCLSLAL